MKRTTIFADEALLLELKTLAHQSHTTVTALVQQALEEFVATRRRGRKLSCAGVGVSGRKDTAERMEQLLTDESADPHRGW